MTILEKYDIIGGFWVMSQDQKISETYDACLLHVGRLEKEQQDSEEVFEEVRSHRK